jgi:DtxR family transcriptional regulator, Mn-dependent transcriptional regulator
VTVRRIGEPAQVEPEALNLLTHAGLMPGQRVRVRRDGGRIVVVREGAEEAAGISLPDDVAAHVFADTPL